MIGRAIRACYRTCNCIRPTSFGRLTSAERLVLLNRNRHNTTAATTSAIAAATVNNGSSGLNNTRTYSTDYDRDRSSLLLLERAETIMRDLAMNTQHDEYYTRIPLQLALQESSIAGDNGSKKREGRTGKRRGDAAIIRKLQEAVDLLCDVIDLRGNDIRALYLRANCYMRLHRMEEALQDYELTVRLSPDFVGGHLGKAECFRMMGRVEQAFQTYKTIIYTFGSKEAHFGRGQLFLRSGMLEEAITDMEHVLEGEDIGAMEDTSIVIGAHLTAGHAQVMLGQLDRAANHYGKILEVYQSDHVEALEGMALCCAANDTPDDHVKALDLLDRCMERGGEDARLLLKRAVSQLALDRNADALESCDRAAKLMPNPLSEAKLIRGQALHALGRLQESLDEFESYTAKMKRDQIDPELRKNMDDIRCQLREQRNNSGDDSDKTYDSKM